MKESVNNDNNTNYKITVFDDLNTSPYNSKCVKTFFNSKNLVVKEIFYEDEDCNNEFITINTKYKSTKRIWTRIYSKYNCKTITIFDIYDRLLNSVTYVNNEKVLKVINKYRRDGFMQERIFYNNKRYNFVVFNYDNMLKLTDKNYYVLNKWDLCKVENHLLIKIIRILLLLLCIIVYLTSKIVFLKLIPIVVILLVLSGKNYMRYIESQTCCCCKRYKTEVQYIIAINNANYICIDCLNDIMKRQHDISDGSIHCNACDNLILPYNEYVTKGSFSLCMNCYDTCVDILNELKMSQINDNNSDG